MAILYSGMCRSSAYYSRTPTDTRHPPRQFTPFTTVLASFIGLSISTEPPNDRSGLGVAGDQQQLHTVSPRLRLYCTVIGLIIKSTNTTRTPPQISATKKQTDGGLESSLSFGRVEIREIRNKIIAHANKKYIAYSGKSVVVVAEEDIRMMTFRVSFKGKQEIQFKKY